MNAEATTGSGGESDLELIRRAARGDRAAIGDLYDRHAVELRGIGDRIVGRGDAEDLVHDVFVEAWQRAGDYDPRRGTVRAWLRVRMRSRCLDRVRRPVNKHAVALDDSEHGGHHRQTAVVRCPEPALVGALTALPDDQATVVNLRYVLGMSCGEIAAQLEVPVGTVKSRLAAALGKLRGRLAT